MKRFHFLSVLIFIPVLLSGQTNTDFWFAAPEVTSDHGDQPIYLRLTSFGQSAYVTISEPANTANFPTQNTYVPANSTTTINLTPYKDQIECKPANTSLNYGLHIHSTYPITAYYEETHQNNPEIFTFKGNNAMGTSFFIPSQDVMYNHSPLNPQAYNSFDIVATEDYTTITITPKKAIVGHPAGTPFVIILNKGQVYSAQATGLQATSHLNGSKVTSDKPICITVKDDSDQYTGLECYDLTGDQIVPLSIIGQEYIVVRGYTNSTMNDWAFVTATADATTVNVNGTLAATLNEGETYRYPLHTADLSSFIETNHPAYVWHLTGYGCEAGSALLPPMNCTGSTQVAFTRTTQYSFELIIITKAGAQSSFTLDGSTTLVTASMFSPVTGNPAFVYARIDFQVGTLPVGAHKLVNSQNIFHMGIIHTYDNYHSGCSYGFFSDFASLDLGTNRTICPGTSTTFDAGPNRQSYEWFYNGSPYMTGVQTITVSNPGIYSVIVNDHGCILSDEVQLINFTTVNPVINGVTSFCQGVSEPLSVTGSYTSYLWNNGETTSSITVSTSGTYAVTVTDNNTCQGSSSINVTVHPIPVTTLAQPASTCSNAAPYPLTGGNPSGGVYSGPGVNSSTGIFDPSSGTGPHLITYTFTDVYGCSSSDSKTLTVNPSPAVQLSTQPVVCISVPPFPLTGGTPPGGTYSGPGVNSSTGIFDPSSGTGPHLITYTFTDANGCSNADSKILTVNPLPVVQLAAQAAVCISAPPFLLTGGTPAGGVYSGPGVNSSTSMFTPSSGPGPHLITYTCTNSNGCINSASKVLTVNPLPVVQLANQAPVCISVLPFQLTGGSPTGGIYSGPGVNSVTGFFDPSSGLGPHLITYTYTDLNGCTNLASKVLTVNPVPVVQLSPQPSVCISDPPFQLTGGTPAGGIYYGFGVNFLTGFFDPSSGAGPHTITYTYTNGYGCSSSANRVLTVNPLPLVQLQDQGAYCISVPPFQLTGGTPEGGIYAGPGVNSVTGMFDPSSGAGPHTITYTYTNENGCPNYDSKILTVNPLPNVQLSLQAQVCLTAPPFLLTGGIPEGGIYSGPGVNSITGFFDPGSGLGPHLITYTYTDFNGCTNAASSILTVNTFPSVQLTAQASACIPGPPYPLTGGTPPGGIYSGPGVNSSTGIFDPSSGTGPHLITYTYSDANGCTDSAHAILIVNPLPIVQLSPQSAVCVSVPPFQLTGGTPPTGTYSGAGIDPGTGIFNPSSGAGPHLITYTYTDGNGCVDSAHEVLTVNPLPEVHLSDQAAVCISVPPYELDGGTPAGGFYSGPGVNSLTGFFDPASGAGAHLIEYTFTDALGCTNTDIKTLIVNPLPLVQLSDFTPVCINAAPFALSGGSPAMGSYSGPGVNTSTGFFSPSVTGPGDYSITYTCTSAEGCTDSASKTIHVIPMPVPMGTINGPDSVCQLSQNIPYNIVGADPLALTFNWEIDPAGAGSVNGSASSIVVSLNGGNINGFGIRFQPVSSCGNGTFSASKFVTVNPDPEVSLAACNDPVTTNGAKPFMLKGGLPLGGVYAIDGVPLAEGILDPSTLSPGPPDHIISYTFTNQYNCAISKTRSLEVKNSPGFTCGNMLTDLRDMKTYPTFEIVTGTVNRCWMASNLDYGDYIQDNLAQTDNCTVEKYCRDNVPLRCTESGGLYQWDELMTYWLPDIAAAQGKQGLCPPEWHVATESEWAALINFFSGPGMAGWSLSDPNPQVGFHAKTHGILYQNLVWAFTPPGISATIFWTSTASSSGDTKILCHGLNEISPSVSNYFSVRTNALPVRCVKD